MQCNLFNTKSINVLLTIANLTDPLENVSYSSKEGWGVGGVGEGSRRQVMMMLDMNRTQRPGIDFQE